MTRELVGGAVLVLLSACGDNHNNTPPPPTTFSGTYTVTAIQCDGGSAPPAFAAAVTGGRSVRLDFADAGQIATLSFSDATCTESWSYNVAYPDAGIFTSTGFGSSVCSPNSETACSALLAAVPALGGTCGLDVDPRTNTWSHTAIPAAGGGTVTLTALDPLGGGCVEAGLQEPFTYTLMKQ